MSHFNVAVITDSEPTDDLLQETLLPWHEYECTGIRRYTKIVDGRRTNPNARWDWWSRGGRWQGMLLTKKKAMAFVGEAGAFDNDSLNEGGVDSCKIKDLDLETMRDNAADRAAEDYDKVKAVIGNMKYKPFEDYRAAHDDIDAARDAYWKQPIMQALTKAEGIYPFLNVENYLVTREQFLLSARKKALQTFALVKDGEWYERGKMGWWAAVKDEKPEDKWEGEFAKLLDECDPQKWITIVDCHI